MKKYLKTKSKYIKNFKINEMAFSSIIASVIILIILVIFPIQKPTSKAVCPDDFKNSETKIDAFKKWINEDFKPKSEETFFSDLAQARKEFYIQNKCTKALQRVEDYNTGKLDQETYDKINKVIKNVFKDRGIKVEK